MLKSLNKTGQFMSASLMTGVATFVSSEAMSQDFNAYTSGASEEVTNVPQIVAYICYLGGFVLAALGVVGLKQHVENPGNAPMKNGLAKLGFGGMLMALPPVAAAIQGSGTNSGDSDTALFRFDDVSGLD